VHDIAAAHQQYAAFPQFRELRAELEVMFGRLGGIDRELYDGDVSVGECMDQHRPRPVIQPPTIVIGADEVRRQCIGDFFGKFGQSRRRILHVEQCLRESEEIVDGLRPRHGRDCGGVDVPVRRHHQDRARARHEHSHCVPSCRVAIALQRVHRAAVAQEHGRHRLWMHVCFSSRFQIPTTLTPC
jgi:hypothetical protein